MEDNQVVEKKSNGFAIASLILGILGGVILAIVGLILGIVGIKKAKETNSGMGLSIAGIVLSVIKILLVVVICFLFSAIFKTEEFRVSYCEGLSTEDWEQACTKNNDGTYSCVFANCTYEELTGSTNNNNNNNNNNSGTPSKEANELKISFYDNTSTGTFWEYTMDDESIVEVTHITDYSGCEGQDGCGGSIIYTVKPLKAGKTTIEFKWVSHSGELREDAIYEIEVSEDLKITETHKGSYFESDYYKES